MPAFSAGVPASTLVTMAPWPPSVRSARPTPRKASSPFGALRLLAQRLDDRQRLLHRDGEADVGGGGGLAAAGDGGVDADDLARGVDERAAGVARGDRCIGLDQSVEELAIGADRAVERRHDAERDRRVAVEPEGEPDGDHVVTEVDAVGIGKGGRLVPVAGHAQQGEVVAGVHGEQVRFARFGLTGEAHTDRRRAVDHVGVGEDLAVGGDDHPGAECVATLHVGADRDDRRRDVIDDAADVDAPLGRVTTARRRRAPRSTPASGVRSSSRRCGRPAPRRARWRRARHTRPRRRAGPVATSTTSTTSIPSAMSSRRRAGRTTVDRMASRRRRGRGEPVVGGDDGVGADHGDGADIGDMPSCLPIAPNRSDTADRLTPVSQLVVRGTGGPAGPPVRGVLSGRDPA